MNEVYVPIDQFLTDSGNEGSVLCGVKPWCKKVRTLQWSWIYRLVASGEWLPSRAVCSMDFRSKMTLWQICHLWATDRPISWIVPWRGTMHWCFFSYALTYLGIVAGLNRIMVATSTPVNMAPCLLPAWTIGLLLFAKWFCVFLLLRWFRYPLGQSYPRRLVWALSFRWICHRKRFRFHPLPATWLVPCADEYWEVEALQPDPGRCLLTPVGSISLPSEGIVP